MFIKEVGNKAYDAAVVGTGPAGISLALRLAQQQGLRILLIESGTPDYSPEASKLSEVEATGDLASSYYPVHAQRILGGTSSVWSGYCAVLEERAFINKEWPIAYSDLEPYYKDAADILELPPEVYQTPSKPINGQSNILYKPYYLSPPVRFNEKYRTILSEHPTIDVIFNKTCTKVLTHEGTVQELLLKNSQGSTATTESVIAKQYILACGGIGNARLLQLSNIATDSPVGRYFTEHPHIYHGGMLELNQDVIEPLLSSGRVVHALQLSDEVCAKHNVLSFSVSFQLDDIKEGFFLGRKKMVYASVGAIRSEMAQQANNRVSLSNNADHLGQAKANIDFAFSYEELGKKSWDILARELLAAGIGRASPPPMEAYSITGGGHYIGTTRMGTAQDNSVVDQNCKVHSTNNLYIAGSSVFASPGAANPTYSLVALALRLADHLSTNIHG